MLFTLHLHLPPCHAKLPDMSARKRAIHVTGPVRRHDKRGLTFSRVAFRLWLAASAFAALVAAPIHADDDARGDIVFFESKIRPLLAARCYECHAQSAKQVQGGLRLDTRAEILAGGESG